MSKIVSLVTGLMATLVLLTSAYAAAPTHIYWTEIQSGTMSRSNLDGTGVQVLVNGLQDTPEIAFDPIDNKMYWVEFFAPALRRANLDGTNIEDIHVSPVVINPTGIDIDVAAGKLYWGDGTADKILRSNLDGTMIEDLGFQGVPGPRGLALDAVNQTIYWTDLALNSVRRENVDGTGGIQIDQLVYRPTGVAVDPVGGKVYVSATGVVFIGGGFIRRYNLDGTDPVDIVTGLSQPLKLALDPDGSKVYWTEFGTGEIRRANLDGTNVETIHSGLSQPLAISLFVPAEPVVIEVNVDIKPGSDPNSINLCSGGNVPVAIFASAELDVADINTDTLRFAEASVKVVGKKDPHTLCNLEDVSGDLIDDLVCHYVTQDIAALDGESSTATVNGELLDGTPFEGTDSVNIVKNTCQ